MSESVKDVMDPTIYIGKKQIDAIKKLIDVCRKHGKILDDSQVSVYQEGPENGVYKFTFEENDVRNSAAQCKRGLKRNSKKDLYKKRHTVDKNTKNFCEEVSSFSDSHVSRSCDQENLNVCATAKSKDHISKKSKNLNWAKNRGKPATLRTTVYEKRLKTDQVLRDILGHQKVTRFNRSFMKAPGGCKKAKCDGIGRFTKYMSQLGRVSDGTLTSFVCDSTQLSDGESDIPQHQTVGHGMTMPGQTKLDEKCAVVCDKPNKSPVLLGDVTPKKGNTDVCRRDENVVRGRNFSVDSGQGNEKLFISRECGGDMRSNLQSVSDACRSHQVMSDDSSTSFDSRISMFTSNSSRKEKLLADLSSGINCMNFYNGQIDSDDDCNKNGSKDVYENASIQEIIQSGEESFVPNFDEIVDCSEEGNCDSIFSVPETSDDISARIMLTKDINFAHQHQSHFILENKDKSNKLKQSKGNDSKLAKANNHNGHLFISGFENKKSQNTYQNIKRRVVRRGNSDGTSCDTMNITINNRSKQDASLKNSQADITTSYSAMKSQVTTETKTKETMTLHSIPRSSSKNCDDTRPIQDKDDNTLDHVLYMYPGTMTLPGYIPKPKVTLNSASPKQCASNANIDAVPKQPFQMINNTQVTTVTSFCTRACSESPSKPVYENRNNLNEFPKNAGLVPCNQRQSLSQWECAIGTDILDNCHAEPATFMPTSRGLFGSEFNNATRTVFSDGSDNSERHAGNDNADVELVNLSLDDDNHNTLLSHSIPLNTYDGDVLKNSVVAISTPASCPNLSNSADDCQTPAEQISSTSTDPNTVVVIKSRSDPRLESQNRCSEQNSQLAPEEPLVESAVNQHKFLPSVLTSQFEEDVLFLHAPSDDALMNESSDDSSTAKTAKRISPICSKSPAQLVSNTSHTIQAEPATTNQKLPGNNLNPIDYCPDACLQNASNIPPSFCPSYIRGSCTNRLCQLKHERIPKCHMYEHQLQVLRKSISDADFPRCLSVYKSLRVLNYRSVPAENVYAVTMLCADLGDVDALYDLLPHNFSAGVLNSRFFFNIADIVTLPHYYIHSTHNSLCNAALRSCEPSCVHHAEKLQLLFDTVVSLKLVLDADAFLVFLKTFSTVCAWTYVWRAVQHGSICPGMSLPGFLLNHLVCVTLQQPTYLGPLAADWLVNADRMNIELISNENLFQLSHLLVGLGCDAPSSIINNILHPHLHTPMPSIAYDSEREFGSDASGSCRYASGDEITYQDTLKSYIHRIKCCEVTKNMVYLGEIFVEMCYKEQCYDQALVNGYVSALNPTNDLSLMVKNFTTFISVVMTRYIKVARSDSTIRLDKRLLSDVAYRLITRCHGKHDWVNGYAILQAFIVEKILLKPPGQEMGGVNRVITEVCVQAGEFRAAENIIEDCNWSVLAVHDESDRHLVGDCIRYVKLLVQKSTHAGEFCLAAKVLRHLLDGISSERYWHDLDLREMCDTALMKMLSGGGIFSAVSVYNVSASYYDNRTKRALFAGCLEYGLLEQVCAMFVDCIENIYPSVEVRTATSSHNLHLRQDVTSAEAQFLITRYLNNLATYISDKELSGIEVPPYDYRLTISLGARTPEVKLTAATPCPFLSKAPRTLKSAKDMIITILAEFFTPPLHSSPTNSSDTIIIIPGALKNYLSTVMHP